MAVAPSLRFTYEDYLLLPEDRRYEILDGDLFMTPAPTPYHQRVSLNLTFILLRHVREKSLGEVLEAPCDVVLSKTDILQPDILFVAADRLSIIGEKYISGPPDLVVEVLSPATADRDTDLKTKIYARFGVKEMWIADPDAKTVAVLTNSGEGFRQEGLFRQGELLRSPLLPALTIPLDEIF
jgi:Uma2 family endonuclease